MNKKTILKKMVIFDYNNLIDQNTANDNCFTCEAEPCVCDCDCDCNCDNCDCDVCDTDGCETCDYYEEG